MFRKLLGVISFATWLVFALALNFTLAHYREISGAFQEDAGLKVINSVLSNPLGLTDIQSWLFLGIGLVCSIGALIEGIIITDPYWGYAALEKRVRKAHDNYIRRKTELIGGLQNIRDEAAQQMEDAQADLGKRRAEHTAIIQGRARVIDLFRQHVDGLERCGNALLSKYRTANRQVRSSEAPGRFEDHWVLKPIPIEAQLPEILLRKDLDQEIKKSEEVLRREIRAVHTAFKDAVDRYRQIDDLIPEEPYGAAHKKSA